MDVYQIVTDRIITLLEQGTIPWRKPWATSSGMPKNLISNKEYRGVNVFLLGCQQYNSPYWLTYKQAVDKGGNVRKGEKSSLCVFWRLNSTQETGGTWETEDVVTPVTPVTPHKQYSQRSAPILKYYNLFNLEQCQGIDSPTQDVPTYTFTPIEKAEQIVSGMKDRPEIQYGGNKAAYSPVIDKIRMPYEDRFEKSEEFYSVLYHELGHSTGHKCRLARKEVMEVNQFGSEPYATEELVADLCSSFLCAHAGISNETIEQSASYTRRWKTMTLTAEEFLRRYLQHVLPEGFHKVRYFGLWSPANRKKLKEVQQQLVTKQRKEEPAEPVAARGRICPCCGKGLMVVIEVLPRRARSPPGEAMQMTGDKK